MATYVLIEGVYDTLDLFSEEIRISLEEKDHRCIILHYDRMDKDLKQLLGARIDAVITFNNLAYNLGESEGQNLWDALNTRYINILMDHPFHYHRQLSGMPGCSEIYCIDKNHVDYIKRYYPHINVVSFLPHAGCVHAITDLSTKKRGNRTDSVYNSVSTHRDIDILYAGNLSRVLIEQLIPDFSQFPEIDGAAFSQDVLSRLISEPDITTEDAILDRLHDLNVPLDSIDDELRFLNGFRFLDGFATSYYRELAVRIPADNGLHVSILGLGWEQCEWTDHDNITLLGKVNAGEVLPYMMRSHIVLNTLTWFKSGAHDRIFNGLLCGAEVVSDNSVYLSDITGTRTNKNCGLHLFDLRDIASLPSILEDILKDPVDPNEQRLCSDWVSSEHSWSARMEEIL